MSQSTTTITSCNSLSATTTHEHAFSVLFSTCPQLTGRDGESGEPDRAFVLKLLQGLPTSQEALRTLRTSPLYLFYKI
jgi:hypothetical protein